MRVVFIGHSGGVYEIEVNSSSGLAAWTRQIFGFSDDNKSLVSMYTLEAFNKEYKSELIMISEDSPYWSMKPYNHVATLLKKHGCYNSFNDNRNEIVTGNVFVFNQKKYIVPVKERILTKMSWCSPINTTVESDNDDSDSNRFSYGNTDRLMCDFTEKHLDRILTALGISLEKQQTTQFTLYNLTSSAFKYLQDRKPQQKQETTHQIQKSGSVDEPVSKILTHAT